VGRYRNALLGPVHFETWPRQWENQLRGPILRNNNSTRQFAALNKPRDLETGDRSRKKCIRNVQLPGITRSAMHMQLYQYAKQLQRCHANRECQAITLTRKKSKRGASASQRVPGRRPPRDLAAEETRNKILPTPHGDRIVT
jgi:hypothetical protein